MYLDRTVRSMILLQVGARAAGFWPYLHCDIGMGRPGMAAARDQAARVVRTEPKTAEDEVSRTAQLADQLRTHVAEEAKRRPADTPAGPTIETPAAPAKAADKPAADKPGKRKFIMMGVFGLLALAAVSYGTYYLLVGRFYVSTDDAYVRA